MADAYARFAVEFEADLSNVQAGLQGGLSMARLYGNQYAGGFAGGLAEGLGNLSGGLNMLQGIRGQFASTAQGLSEIFGMKASADIEYYRRQLTALVGDAEKANKILGEMTDIANTTAFSNTDIFRMTTNMIGTGTSPDQATGEVRNILDAVASSGTRDMAAFRRFAVNLMDLRLNPGEANQKDVIQALRASPALVKQAADTLGLPQKEATDKVFSMAGPELYDLFLKIGQRNQGRAKAEGMADPFVAAESLGEMMKTAQAATGSLVNSTLLPLMRYGVPVVETFAKINKIGGGIPGLALGVGILVAAYRIHYGATLRAAAALERLARSVPANPGAPGGKSGGFSFTRVAGGIALATIGYGVMDQLSKDLANGKGAVGGVGKGLQYLLHPDTTMITKSWNALTGKESTTPGDKLEKAADKLTKAAETLDASADGYGGGKRFKSTLSSIEAGYALVGAERLGIG